MQDINQLAQENAKYQKTQPVNNLDSALRSGQHTLIRSILRIVSFLGLFALTAGVYDLVTTGQYLRFVVIAVVYLGLLIVAFTPGVTYGIQVGVFLLVLYAIGIFYLITTGYTGNGVLFLLAVSVLAPLLLSQRIGIIFTILIITTAVIFAFLFVNHIIYVPVEAVTGLDDVNAWVTGVIVLILIGAILTIPQKYILQRFTTALSQEQELTHELESERVNLEKRIAERTQIVTRRAGYLAASAVVAREAAGVIDDPAELLRRVVNLITEEFGFYHTGLFLNDERSEWTVLKAASSEGGQKMLARTHRLLIGSQGIVGYVALRGESRIALDVGSDAVFFDNPDLPDTRSEIALPLIVRGEVIGVLDVQSTTSQAFDEDGISALQSLADQVAMAISNARLFTLARESVEAEKRLRGEISNEGWRELLQAEPNLKARSATTDSSPDNELWTPEMTAALLGAEPVVDTDSQKSIAIPVRVAGHSIGVVAARKPSNAEQWSGEEMRLICTLTDQLGAAVERARLFRQSQVIASRQRKITEVGARMRSSLQMETMIQTAANEIRDALNLGDVEIRLAPPPLVPNQVESSARDNGEN